MSDWELGAWPHRKSMRRWISQIRIFLNPELSAQQIPSAFSRGDNTQSTGFCKGSKSENKFIRSRAQRPVDSRGSAASRQVSCSGIKGYIANNLYVIVFVLWTRVRVELGNSRNIRRNAEVRLVHKAVLAMQIMRAWNPPG